MMRREMRVDLSPAASEERTVRIGVSTSIKLGA